MHQCFTTVVLNSPAITAKTLVNQSQEINDSNGLECIHRHLTPLSFWGPKAPQISCVKPYMQKQDVIPWPRTMPDEYHHLHTEIQTYLEQFLRKIK